MTSLVENANADVLLDTLSSQLPKDVHQLIQSNPDYKQEALSFLSEFLQSSNDGSDLLLSTSLQPSLDASKASHTLIEQVAELDSQQRNLETQLRNKLVGSLDKSLNSTKVLDEVSDLFINDFNEDVDYLLSNFVGSDEDDENNEGSDEDNDVASDSSVIKQPNVRLTDEVSNWKNIILSSQKLSKESKDKSGRVYVDGNDASYTDNENDVGITSSSVILRNMDSIMDILELATLTNACVKQGHYAECVEIASHVRRLAIRYSDIPLIAEVEKRVKYEIREMISGLIRLLNTDLKQSSIIKIVSYLKRIGPFSSIENSNNSSKSNELLKKIYLKSRYQFIINELEVLIPLKRSNSIDRYLKRCLEVIREHCFGTIMTYESIFLSEESQNKKITNTLLYSFIKATILHLCGILSECLPQITEPSVKNGLLLQLVYCSQSLSRMGGNFSVMVLDDLGSKGVLTKQEWFSVLKKQKELIKSLSKTKTRS